MLNEKPTGSGFFWRLFCMIFGNFTDRCANDEDEEYIIRMNKKDFPKKIVWSDDYSYFYKHFYEEPLKSAKAVQILVIYEPE